MKCFVQVGNKKVEVPDWLLDSMLDMGIELLENEIEEGKDFGKLRKALSELRRVLNE